MKLLRWGVLIVLVVLVAGIVLSNYSTGLSLALGLLLLIIGAVLLQRLKIKRKTIFLVIGFLIILAPVLFVLFGILHSAPYIGCNDGATQVRKEVTGFYAEIETSNFSNGEFQVEQKITYREVEYSCVGFRWEKEHIQEGLEKDFQNQTVHSTDIGLFMYEVTIPTNLNDYDSCCVSESRIVLKNLPFNSFLDAQYAEDLSTDEYLGKEIIIWRGYFLEDGIHFAYVPAPFYNIRVLLTPFIELSKFDNWVLAIIGFVISAVFTAIIKPSVLDWVEEKAKNLFTKEDPTKKAKPPKRKTNRNQ